MKTLFFQFILLTLTSFLLSCGTQPVVTQRSRPQAPVEAKTIFQSAQKEYKKQNYKVALEKLKVIIKKHSDSDLIDETYLMMGDIYTIQKDYQYAYQAYLHVAELESDSSKKTDALLLATQSLLKLSKNDEALKLTADALEISGLQPEQKSKIYQVRLAIFKDQGKKLETLKLLIDLSGLEKTSEEKEKFRLQANELVEQLTDEELEKIANDSDYALVRPPAMFRLGKHLSELGHLNLAKNYLENVAELSPKTEIGEKAHRILAQIQAQKSTEPFTVGVVLPLTGKYANVGHKTLRGIQLGLGIYGVTRSNFRLAVIDSEGNPDMARRAVERLVTEDHVVAIIGSLLSKTAVAVASKAQELGVPNIALSQKSDLTDIGNTVFRNALTSKMQVQQLVDTAMNTLGMKRFAILYPNDSYGVEYANIFWDEVLSRGGEIRAAQTYDIKETDFGSHVQRLVGTYYTEDRLEEYKLRFKDWLESQTRRSARNNPPEDILPPVVDFEAVFIPDGVKAVGQIAPMLQYNDVSTVRLLGTNLWNTPALVKRGGKFIESCIFVDTLQTDKPEFSQSNFYHDFKNTFEEEPSAFELQAYDAALVLRQLIASGAQNRENLSMELEKLKDFPGGIGPINMSLAREIKRPLSVLTVKNAQITELTPENAHPEIKNQPKKAGKVK